MLSETAAPRRDLPNRICRFVYVEGPGRIGRIAASLARHLRDSNWVVGVPAIGILLPILGLLAGAAAGGRFASAVLVAQPTGGLTFPGLVAGFGIAILVGLAARPAGLGLLAGFGAAVVVLVGTDASLRWTTRVLEIVLVLFLAGMLTVAIPAIVSTVAGTAGERTGRRSPAFGLGLETVVALLGAVIGAAVFGLAQSLGWRSLSAIRFGSLQLDRFGPTLGDLVSVGPRMIPYALVGAVLGTLGRATIQHLRPQPDPPPLPPQAVPARIASLLFRAIGAATIAMGSIEAQWRAMLIATTVSVFVLGLWGSGLIGRPHWYCRTLNRVPVLLRAAVLVALGFVASWMGVSAYVSVNAPPALALDGLAAPLFISLIAAAALFPPEPRPVPAQDGAPTLPRRGVDPKPTAEHPARWYADPVHPGILRYWNGTRWTDQWQPAEPDRPPNVPTLFEAAASEPVIDQPAGDGNSSVSSGLLLSWPDGSLRVAPDSFTEVSVGRAQECDVVVIGPHVSRHHLTISGGPPWHVQDHSSGGSWVDGERLTVARVEQRLLIRLGSEGDAWIELVP